MYTNEEIKSQVIEAVKKVKSSNPMAGSITNSVTINFVANASWQSAAPQLWYIFPMKANFLQTREAQHI